MKKNEGNKDKSQEQNSANIANNLQGGIGAPNLRDVHKENIQEGNRPTNKAAGAKPRVSGRHGSMDAQDGGQDLGSSAGSH